MKDKELIELNRVSLKELREKWVKEQNNICPILKKEYSTDKFVIDHRHKLKSEFADTSGKGCVRGAINFLANSFEGKVTNSFKRLGLDKEIDIVSALRNLADYLEYNKLNEDVLYIHPNEVEKKPLLTKRCYNKLVQRNKKGFGEKKKIYKIPPYNGNLNKRLKELFEKYDIEIELKRRL